MRVKAIMELYATIFFVIALVMVFANPFFEDKKLLKLTLIPVTACLALVTILVGWL